MTRLGVSVEGATERAFVRALLAEHLRTYGVAAVPVLIGRPGHGYGAGGGDVGVERLAAHMAHLLRSFDAVTSLVDFYGFRRKGEATVEELESQVGTAVAAKAGARFGRRPVLPYVQRHEFEALLFSDVTQFGRLESAPRGVEQALAKIRARFETPEDIDDSPTTAPSKRLEALIPRYEKVAHGSSVAERTGLPKIRAACPRFDRWIAELESLGDDPSATAGKAP